MSVPGAPWRLFVAVPIPDELRDRLARAVDDLRQLPGGDDWRWTDPDGWHLTLAFLGSTDQARVPALTNALTRAAGGLERFTVGSGGLGVFPSRSAARVLWYGTGDPDSRLRDLAERVQAAVGAEERRPYRGHLTLARAREPRGVPAGDLLSAANVPDGSVVVEEVVLFRSHLGRGPARYEALSRVPLEAPTHLAAARP